MTSPKCPKCSLPMEFYEKPVLFTKEKKAYAWEAIWQCSCGEEKPFKLHMPKGNKGQSATGTH